MPRQGRIQSGAGVYNVMMRGMNSSRRSILYRSKGASKTVRYGNMSCGSISGDGEYEESLVTKRHYLKPTVVEVDAHA